MNTQSLDTPMRTPSRSRLAWLLSALIIAGCGGTEAVLLAPFFTFGFSFTGQLGGANHELFLNLNPGAPTTATGNFEAFSTLRIDSDTHDVIGSYTGCTMTLTLAPTPPATTIAAPLATSYNGRFTGPNTIELTPTSGARPVLTLTRFNGQTDPRAQTC